MKRNEWIYYRMILPVISFFVNCWYWAFNLDQIHRIRVEMMIVSTKIRFRSLPEAIKFIGRFVYIPDKFDWVPWVSTTFLRHHHGDCDDAAVRAKWIIKQIGMPTPDIYHLRGIKCGHAVCVGHDKSYFVSNEQFSIIPIDERFGWEEVIFKHFDGKYTRLFK